MSEEINESHLCTTEDAFEKFQAVSMYEEDEYISLSDIVPAEAQTPDLVGEICDVPYEEEVVLESNQDEQVHEVNSTNESVFDENKKFEPSIEQCVSTSESIVCLQNDSLNTGNKILSEAGKKVSQAGPNDVSGAGQNDISEAGQKDLSGAGQNSMLEKDHEAGSYQDMEASLKPKRGRKKKTTCTVPTSSNTLKNGTPEVSTLPQEQNTDILKASGLRRRGRPPKNASKDLDIIQDVIVSPADISEVQSTSLTPVKDDPQNSVKNATVRRRGRPKKNHSNKEIPELTLSSDAKLLVNKTNENVPGNFNLYETPRKKGKNMRLLSSEKSESESNEVVDQTINDNVESQPIKKSPGKRGRPRKTYSNEMALNNEQPKLNDRLEHITEKNKIILNNDDDETDDICLSQLKTSQDLQEALVTSESACDISERATNNNETNDLRMEIELSEENTPSNEVSTTQDKTQVMEPNRNSTNPELVDFEQNIDIVMSEQNEKSVTDNEPIGNDADPNNLLVEDTSKRPTRRRTRKPMLYDEGSDEDPFANVELSDDEPIGCKKKYYSDDEYIPGKNKKGKSESSDTDSDIDLDNIERELTDTKRKRQYKKSEGCSPAKGAKRGRKSINDKAEDISPSVTTPKLDSVIDDDVEVCLTPNLIKTKDDKKNKEFENFLAKKIQGTDIKIKKKSTVQPLEIPVINPSKQKKTVEQTTQTKEISTTSASVQTSAMYDIPMKDNITLSTEQSEKACEFLNSIVKTTADLGELMTQKSQDFMKKKINTEHVTDTFKMDYCVRKSFLLFKLAKHNLMQMEEDLAQQYDDFLKIHNLQQYREQPKIVTAAPKTEGSDSDCEIVETPVIQTPTKKKKQPATFNPKTVFLNKELSIKIAKKTPAKDTKPQDKKINIKGRHTVWINDSIMVKKVKPTQSFLAQDSRNKKPPDYVTIEMVSSFFKQYYRQKALAVCAPFVSTEWLAQTSSIPCYFFAISDDVSVSTGIPSSSEQYVSVQNSSNPNHLCDILVEETKKSDPITLFSLCIKVLTKHINNMSVPHAKTTTVMSTPKHEYNPRTLYGLCINSINMSNLAQNVAYEEVDGSPDSSTSLYQEEGEKEDNLLWESNLLYADDEDASSASTSVLLDQDEVYSDTEYASPLTLKTLCYIHIVKLMFINNEHIRQNIPEQISVFNDAKLTMNLDKYKNYINNTLLIKNNHIAGVKSLFSRCIDLVRSCMTPGTTEDKDVSANSKDTTKKANFIPKPKPLKNLTFERIVNIIYTNDDCAIVHNINLPKKVKSLSDLCFEIVTKCCSAPNDYSPREGLTINSINTLTEEAYFNIQRPELAENIDYYEDDSNFFDDEVESGINNLEDENATVDNNWLSQVQMKELRSCYTPNTASEADNNVLEPINNIEDPNLVSRIKLEPVDDFQENIETAVMIKTEPLSHHPDEMTMIPETFVTKTEYLEASDTHTHSSSAPIQRQNSSSYDVDTFEAFVSTNKMMHNLDEYSNDEEGVFSQSALRIRRQFEPDDLSETENDIGMSLLIPQTFEPLRIENNAKNRLMESSSDESNNCKKVSGKKKSEKRPRVRPKKNDTKNINAKLPPVPLPKDKNQSTNEIAILTRRMRDKIRQEEKKVVSSESESESENLLARKIKQKEERNKAKSFKVPEESKGNQDATDSKNKKVEIDEIQCSNVDSTEQINESRIPSPSDNSFTGFTAVDQNEISSYQKYVKYVYDQILPKVTEEAEVSKECKKPVTNPEDPVELLECEPTMSFFSQPPTVKRRPGPKTKTQILYGINKTVKKDETENKSNEGVKKQEIFIERHGWKCYPLDGNDAKLYQTPQLLLEKLPETFVQTYFMYQNIASKNDEDEEVDKLINLQSLNRTGVKDTKVNKNKAKIKIPDNSDEQPESNYVLDGSFSPTFSENADELTPSEDEGGKIEDDVLPPVSKPTSDNNLAKNSLMNENESDADELSLAKIKQEPLDDGGKVEKGKSKKSKTKKVEEAPPGPVMLTADKMMNKELNLLHAPINLNDTVEPVPSKSRSTKSKPKSATKTSPKDHTKTEEDSSSEEEKHQWFTIKEKLLKRMVKKNDTTREDDAKRAKLVSEFIERRGDSSEAFIKRRCGRSSRRVSKKKMLERQKQLKVLTRELFGDPSNDASLHPKRAQAQQFKGRRNIRKVIDKKSLAKSTVVANMEEFERKRRINIRQSKLREIMQCEEGVNVLVINDEVCLEYDFEAHRPVVTIHPFFTKVMKAHQYEGVKFMWDACFESLDMIASGHPGGGCILAHCMGLGKTLQVLALLHTVLTHPRVGMTRVLVCCPLSTVLNWVDEIHKWIGPVTNQIKVFELSKLRKTSNRAYQLEDWYTGGGIFIIGYELFRSLTTLDPFLDDVRPAIVNKIRTALLDPGPDIIICDEGHLLKNDCSVLAVAMSRVVTKRRIVLTGTPMQNNLREYYCMVNFVKPNLLGTYAEYSNRFENPIMNGQHRDSQEQDIKLMKARTHILHKVLEGCLQRQEASVLYPYLPKKHEYTVFISLTKCQWDLYKHFLQNYSNTQNNKSVLKDFHTLQKIWSHPQVLHNFQNMTGEATRRKVKEEKLEDDLAREELDATEDIKPTTTETWWLPYLDDGSMNSLASSNKFVAVFRILEESIALQDKVLIFSTSLYTMDTLEYFLKKINNWSLGQEYYRLDGSVPAEVRQKWCREFNAENNHKTKLFLISTRAGCLGLNMTAANRVIILDTSWNPAHDIQSIFRVYRFGQKKDCYIYRLVALGTMEQKIYERSVTKQAVACRVVDEQQIDRHYNMAELTELYKYDETGAGVAGGLAAGVEDLVLLRVARDAALHAVHEHDSLLRGSHEQGLPEHERRAAWLQFQEEHAHKPEQQEIPKPVKIKKVKVANQSPADSASHSSWAVVKNETEESILPNDPDFTPVQVKPKSRARKGRAAKSNIVTCCIPIQPEAPEAEEPPEDEDMVKKITQILIKHNYQINQGPIEIAQLVSRVREHVHSGNLSQLEGSDELTKSIARVLLGKKSQAPPPLTDVTRAPDPAPVTHEQTDKPEESLLPPPKSRGRSRRGKSVNQSEEKIKKGYVYEAVPTTSTEPEPDSEGRTRRRAALAAERNFEPPLADPVIDLDDDSRDREILHEVPTQTVGAADANEDTDSGEELVYPNIQIKSESDNSNSIKKSPRSEVKKAPKSEVKKNDSITDTKQKKRSITDLKAKSVEDEASIVLSDDEDYVPPPYVERKKQRAGKNMIVNKVESQPSSSKNSELIPLHPSLLSNKNFIKIVAHTYLSGNPMLDEDAATLAAQYSTFKALKEYEALGKSIDSGPIYDIAVKVLGVDVLKKLHISNVKMSTNDMLAQHPINNTQDAAPAQNTGNKLLKQALKAQESKAPTERASRRKSGGLSARKSLPTASAQTQSVPSSITETSAPENKPVVIKIRIPSQNRNSNPLPMPAVPASPAGVVPVGLFKGAAEVPASQTQSADECILPDDDDIRIITDPTLAPPSLPAAPVTPATRRNPHPVLNTANDRPVTTFYSLPTGDSELRPDYALAGPISLDSDDEDAPAPAPVPQGPVYAAQPNGPPVPITLTAVHASAVPAHSRSAIKILRKVPNPTTHSSIVKHPMTANDVLPGPNSHPAGQIVLVPASSFAPSAPVPVALNKVRYTTPAAQSHTPAVQSLDLTDVTTYQPTAPAVMSPDIGAEQTVETTLHDCASKAHKRMCKPGDILRINQGGNIEALNKNDLKLDEDTVVTKKTIAKQKPPAPTGPTRILRGCVDPTRPSKRKTGAASKTSQNTSSNNVPKSNLQTSSAPPASDPKASNARKGTSSSVTTIPSRSPSPNDIFKNVVRIEADDYASQSSSLPSKKMTENEAPKNQALGNRSIITMSVGGDAPTAKASTSRSGKWQPPVSHTAKTSASNAKPSMSATKPSVSNTKPSVSNTKPSVSNTKPPTSNTKPSTSNTKPSTSNTKLSASTVKPSSTATETSASSTKASVSSTPQKTTPSISTHSKTNTIKAKERILDSVDLTDLDYLPPVTLGSHKKPQTTTIVGTSKSIILCASGKAVSKAVDTSTKSNTTTTPPAVKTEIKKRPAPVDTGLAKKKKTDKPMTLKDFDIDDIDDIIELD